MELLALLGLGLLVVGVVGSVVPGLPGTPVSLAGVLVYWGGTGFSEPGPLLLAGLVLVGLVGTAVDFVGGAVAAKAGGASTLTTAVAVVVGIVLAFVTGPLGLLVGVAGTVFALEFYRKRDARASGRAAVVATVGVLASAVVQVLISGTMLAAMLWVALA
jgi:hypothetical protein